jgi:lysophospholipase L1-like esterase
MTIQLKRNDTKDTISYKLTNADNSAVNLTGATVRFVMGRGNVLLTNAEAVIADAATGEVEYALTESDTLTAGMFHAEFEVTFSDGKIKTYPNNGYILVNIQPNVDSDMSTYVEDAIALRVSDIEVFKNDVNAKVDQAVADAAKVNDFESRIDNIVAQAGTDNTEIVDARLRNDGTVAPTVGSHVRELGSQLAEKAEQTDVDKKRDKSVPITDTDISDTLRQQIAGTAAVNAVPSEKTVSPLKTTFFKRGNNLFNKATVNTNYYVSNTNGNLVSGTDFHTSDYIFVDPSTAYFANRIWYHAFYDGNKVFISGANPGNVQNYSITTPANAKYLRFTYFGNFADTIMFNKGVSALPYEAYTEYFDTDSFKDKTIPWNKIKDDKALKITDTEFVTLGKNLFDKETVTIGKFVNNTNGTLADNASFASSDFIKVLPNATYTIGNQYYMAFYDANKAYISGQGSVSPQSNPRTVTTPSNAAYIRVSEILSRLDLLQVESGSMATAYEPYRYKFTKEIPEFIVNLNLPPAIPALVGKEVNIYFDNILNDDATKYQIDVTCVIGKQQAERWTCVPSATGTYPLTIDVYKNHTIKVATASTTVTVKDVAVGNGVNRSLMIIGDSTTDNGVNSQGAVTAELLNLFGASDVMDITLKGTRGLSPNLHEGRSGWQTLLYTTMASKDGVVNAFWNPTTSAFDFSYYMQQQGYSTVDYVVINLGINDVFSYTDDYSLNTEITSVLNRYQTMVDSIKTFSSTIKIGIALTIPPSFSQDSFGDDYSSGQTRWRYKRNNQLWVKALINQFKGKESQLIYLLPLNINLDTVNNMLTETVPVNSRNTNTVVRQNNGVHPAPSGYLQIADAYYYWLKNFES